MIKEFGQHIKELIQGMTTFGFFWCFIFVYLLFISLISSFLTIFINYESVVRNSMIISSVKYTSIFISVGSCILCVKAARSSWRRKTIFSIATVWIIATSIALIIHFIYRGDEFPFKAILEVILPAYTITFMIEEIGPLLGIRRTRTDKEKQCSDERNKETKIDA